MTPLPDWVGTPGADTGDRPQAEKPGALQAGIERGREDKLPQPSKAESGHRIDFGVGQ